MMLSIFLLLAPTQSAPPQEAPKSHAWWRDLRPEDQERMHQRWGDYQKLSPEGRETLKRRLEALEQERSVLWRRLGEQDRKNFEGLAEPDRQRWLDERVRERIRERGMNLEQRAPGFCDRLRELPPEERMRRAADFLHSEHAERARQDLELAVKDNWLGAAAAVWLRQAPPEELLTAMGQVQRWRFLQRAESEGFWQQNGITPEMKSHLLELPVPFFFEEIQRLERGDAPLGPPGNWRGGPPGRHHRDR